MQIIKNRITCFLLNAWEKFPKWIFGRNKCNDCLSSGCLSRWQLRAFFGLRIKLPSTTHREVSCTHCLFDCWTSSMKSCEYQFLWSLVWPDHQLNPSLPFQWQIFCPLHQTITDRFCVLVLSAVLVGFARSSLHGAKLSHDGEVCEKSVFNDLKRLTVSQWIYMYNLQSKIQVTGISHF